MARTPVLLNIYDMYWLNEYASNIGVGVFHSGIEVYGIEYAYGGHPLPFSGVFENSPKDANELGENFKYRETIVIGETDFSATEVKKMISLMGEEYRGDRYHLISKNCNHFSSTLAKTLTGNDIPGWINRLATISGSIPFLERWVPQEWLTPVALQNSLDEKTKTISKNNTNFNGISSKNNRMSNETFSSTQSTSSTENTWKLFRRASSTAFTATNLLSNAANRSVPNSARSEVNLPTSTNSTLNITSFSSQSLSRLWSSIKNIGAVDTSSLKQKNNPQTK